MKIDEPDYIIVQAGGKGTRMESLTRLKPKALVPVNNLPMIFHLFKNFPDKKFIIIGDHKYDVLEKYLSVFAKVDHKMVRSTGQKGTCAGIREAVSHIPESDPFLLIWSDLVLPEDYKLPRADDNIIGISKDFPCRWKYENGEFEEERSSEFGVAGFFIFKSKSCIQDVPMEGEFVKWLKQKKMKFTSEPLYKTREYGLKSEWDKLPAIKSRPFNSIKKEGDRLYKLPLDKQGERLAKHEISWYKKLQSKDFKNIPHIYGYEPLCMEFIKGKCVYEYRDIDIEEKKRILKEIVSCLRSIHKTEIVPADKDSFYEAYIGKTFNRLDKIKKFVPFAENEYIFINGKKCRNVFFCRDELGEKIMSYLPESFYLIHGDCTFSNILLKNDSIPILIDPRGYFGTTELYGDSAYDWVKLYYSLYSNYDRFNLKQFELFIDESGVRLTIESNGWEELEDSFYEYVGDEISRKQMKLFLAVIWLSLTTYAWENYDSVCGAFYNGCFYLEEALNGDGIQ